MARAGAEVGKMVQRGCDMVTIVVPPALPLTHAATASAAAMQMQLEEDAAPPATSAAVAAPAAALPSLRAPSKAE
jgi:hypothetical protein